MSETEINAPSYDDRARLEALNEHWIRVDLKWDQRITGLLVGVGYQGITIGHQQRGKLLFFFSEIAKVTDLGIERKWWWR